MYQWRWAQLLLDPELWVTKVRLKQRDWVLTAMHQCRWPKHRSVIVVVMSRHIHVLTVLKLTTKGHSLVMMMQHVSQSHCLCCQFINHACMHAPYNYQCTWHDMYVCQACITLDGPLCDGQMFRAVQAWCRKWYTEYNQVCMCLTIISMRLTWIESKIVVLGKHLWGEQPNILESII